MPEDARPNALHAPWRLPYLEELDARERAAGADEPATGSFLRDYWLAPQHDEANHVVVRTAHGLILLNRFPYANGHLLVCLGEGRPRLLDHDPDDRGRFWRLVDAATDLLERTLNPQGVNTGINQGRAAGAGVPHHLHAHLVPRWGGDVNFLSAVGQVRVIPASLDEMAKRYRVTWETIREDWAEPLAR